MVEKILRTEPDVGKIFVLIKGKSQEAAVDIMKIEVAFLNSVCFCCEAYSFPHRSHTALSSALYCGSPSTQFDAF